MASPPPNPNPTQPTIVFVPGAWHTPSTYDLLLPPLHAAGYPTASVHLATVGATGPVTFADDVSAIRNVVSELVELGREVVLVTHSYSGHPGTEAVAGLGRAKRKKTGLAGGVILLVYIAAIVPIEGQSSVDAFGPMTPKEEGGPWLVLNDLGNGFISLANGEEALYHDLPPAAAKHHASLLQTHYQPASAEPLTCAAYKDITAVYFFCDHDRAFPIERQRKVVNASGILRARLLRTGHSPFLSDPDTVAEFIMDYISRTC
ncbi:Alpha/beta hydrolase fold-1 [Aspergillus varians]